MRLINSRQNRNRHFHSWHIFILFMFSGPVFSDDYVVNAHYCYGNDREWFIEGRIIEERNDTEAKLSDNWLQNLWRKARQLSNDEEKDTSIGILAQERFFSLETDDEGFFNTVIKPLAPVSAGWYEIKSSFNDATKPLCQLLVPDKNNKIGIISDFDDTVIVSNITSKPKAIFNALTLNFKQRELVTGTPERFRGILKENLVPEQALLFFVTGSHKQMQRGLEDFLEYHNFPSHTTIAKKISGQNPDPVLDQYQYKLEKITHILKLYPEVTFTLFGDNGEK
ncbi:MAG: DUF2183 domain-containing protein, partial [Gammaproteobacteria bacterium]|nr:DUF2183 domain-containing protein [Gammaproteobacteria bacterium]